MIISSIVLISAILGGIIVWVYMRNVKVENPQAEIYSEGKLIYRLSLSEATEFTVTTDSGNNTITIADGKISVTAADCPDKVCVNTGAVSGGNIPIICLPHKLEIRIVSGSSTIDAQVN